MASSDDSDVGEKTEFLKGDSETLNQEMEQAKKQDACLIMIRGPMRGHRFFLNQPEMIIGRDPCEITIVDSSISRKHAKITKQDGAFFIEDLGSSNGTNINGRNIIQGQPQKLGKEDMIRLGNSIVKYLPAGELEILVYGDLANAAHTDPMTKIYNKRYLNEALDAEFKRAQALGNPLSLLFFDIDHFKKINDTYGHDAGDYVLKELTSMVRSKILRPKDVFARFGGEEFVILLLNTNEEQADDIGERVRAGVEAHHFSYEGKQLPITTSVGVAELSSTMDSAQTLLKCADKALYASKAGGRNKVTVFR